MCNSGEIRKWGDRKVSDAYCIRKALVSCNGVGKFRDFTLKGYPFVMLKSEKMERLCIKGLLLCNALTYHGITKGKGEVHGLDNVTICTSNYNDYLHIFSNRKKTPFCSRCVLWNNSKTQNHDNTSIQAELTAKFSHSLALSLASKTWHEQRIKQMPPPPPPPHPLRRLTAKFSCGLVASLENKRCHIQRIIQTLPSHSKVFWYSGPKFGEQKVTQTQNHRNTPIHAEDLWQTYLIV